MSSGITSSALESSNKLISGLDDKYFSRQKGENGHTELKWTQEKDCKYFDFEESLVQINFQLVRTKKIGEEQSSNLIYSIRNFLFNLQYLISNNRKSIVSGKDAQLKNKNPEYFLLLFYKLIGYTRDIINGKGEYALSYMLVYEFYRFFPELAERSLCNFFYYKNDKNSKEHPYGSFKDIKYFCNYCYVQSKDMNHPLIKKCINISKEQLEIDSNTTTDANLSLFSKWCPRETSSPKFSWIFDEIACSYFKKYLDTAKNSESVYKAKIKCKMELRKLLSKVNKKLDTMQIKQCNRKWADINPKNITSITFQKQRKALLNKTKDDKQRSNDPDRIKCSVNVSNFIQNAAKGLCEVKGKRVSMLDFTKQALGFIQNIKYKKINKDDDEVALLNLQWKNNGLINVTKNNSSLKKSIAIVDVSGSMAGDPLHAAISIGIRIAENSILGKRVMTFSSRPEWVMLGENDTYVEMVDKINTSQWQMNTDLYAVFTTLLETIVNKNISPEEACDMSIIILSDMQIDAEYARYKTQKNTLIENVKKMYAEAGLRSIYKTPYKIPHIVLWNLRQTNGFPACSTDENCSMVSGFSPAILNNFIEEGNEIQKVVNPFNILVSQLMSERYKEEEFDEYFLEE